jgi:hypothetical protein
VKYQADGTVRQNVLQHRLALCEELSARQHVRQRRAQLRAHWQRAQRTRRRVPLRALNLVLIEPQK